MRRDLSRFKSVSCVLALVMVATIVSFKELISPTPFSKQYRKHLETGDMPEDLRGLRLTNQTQKTKIFSTHFDVAERDSGLWLEFPLTDEQCRNVTFVTVTNRGRLGNMIGEYASVFSYGMEYGKIPVLSGNLLESLLPLFPHLSLRRENETGCSPRNWTEMGIPPGNDPRFVRDNDIFLPGFPNYSKLHHKFRREWMPDFRFDSKLVQRTESFFPSLSVTYGGDSTFIGIHVRRTDQIAYNKEKHEAGTVSAGYYKRAMEHFGLIFSKVVFVLASDDLKWSRENVENVDENMPIVFVEGKDRDFDFTVLSHCNHSIVSVGTFGFFAAYFSGGLVIAPKIISKSPLAIEHLVSHAGLDNWIFIPN
ncbi:unnamed protein product [Darwinula stevensoni]|uniref:L-Fucosyltransferase n=1 Tax=Darwinula stevensoni TaxID=69355 RepID=A0A7R9A6G8_9CRUS|nr:unnamed protein product [Darwinula stevensoni]CAG0887765.1 unnamed protein product [Darwinula stevensoni]